MAGVWVLAFTACPFLLLGVVDLLLPWPPMVRYVQLALSTGLCLITVALVGHAGLLSGG